MSENLQAIKAMIIKIIVMAMLAVLVAALFVFGVVALAVMVVWNLLKGRSPKEVFARFQNPLRQAQQFRHGTKMWKQAQKAYSARAAAANGPAFDAATREVWDAEAVRPARSTRAMLPKNEVVDVEAKVIKD